MSNTPDLVLHPGTIVSAFNNYIEATKNNNPAAAAAALADMLSAINVYAQELKKIPWLANSLALASLTANLAKALYQIDQGRLPGNDIMLTSNEV